MNTLEKSEILEHLKKNEMSNLNIINFIENYPIHYVDKTGDSVVVKGTSDRDWIYISSKSSEELRQIKAKLTDDDKNFAIIEDWMLPILTQKALIKWKMSTTRLILPNQIKIEKPIQSLTQLTVEDASFLYENSNYKEYMNIEYVIDRIKNGINSCVQVGNKKVAWAMTQDDGAIGFLHVLPEYRNKGYARNIMMDLINKVRAKNIIPFAHIVEDNFKSMNLALSLGFKKDKTVSWFEIEKIKGGIINEKYD